MKKFLAGAVALALTAGSATSADLYQPQAAPLMDAPEVSVREASGWYLRGDAGYSFNELRGAKFRQGGSYDADFRTAKIEDSGILGAGVGYQFNNYFRGDLTFDYMTRSDFRGSTTGGGAGIGGGACAITCTSSDRSSFSAYSLMANAYVDVATVGSVTGYVGAGLGASYVNWRTLRNTSCPDAGGACDQTFDHEGKGSWRLSYALMAGATIDITCDLKADIGYRYRRINGGDMFGLDIFGGGPGRDKGINSHEARLGARYIFGGCDVPQQASYEPPPPPMVYK